MQRASGFFWGATAEARSDVQSDSSPRRSFSTEGSTKPPRSLRRSSAPQDRNGRERGCTSVPRRLVGRPDDRLKALDLQRGGLVGRLPVAEAASRPTLVFFDRRPFACDGSSSATVAEDFFSIWGAERSFFRRAEVRGAEAEGGRGDRASGAAGHSCGRDLLRAGLGLPVGFDVLPVLPGHGRLRSALPGESQ